MAKVGSHEHVLCACCGKRHKTGLLPVTPEPRRVFCSECEAPLVIWSETTVTYYSRPISDADPLKRMLGRSTSDVIIRDALKRGTLVDKPKT